jgi:glycerol-3-phosphate dehydrogenase (NAD(P)+)
MSYISVIGAGSWGTTLAYMLSDKGYDVSLWVYEKDLAESIRATRINSTYLPEITLPDELIVTNLLEEAVSKARYIINAVPTQFTRSIFSKAAPLMNNDAIIVSVSKGIE